jgi:hypothetical protein
VPKYLAIGLLALSGFAAHIPFYIPSIYYKYLALVGMGITIAVLASNLGSRAWKNLKIKPYPLDRSLANSFFKFIGVYIISILVGIIVPFLGFKKVQIGGLVAIRHILVMSVTLYGVILISDPNILSMLSILPYQTDQMLHQQKLTTIVLGTWWMTATLVSLYLSYLLIPLKNLAPEPSAALLTESNLSPVGYCVLHIPSHLIETVERFKPPKIGDWGIVVLAVLATLFPGFILAAFFAYSTYSKFNDKQARY